MSWFVYIVQCSDRSLYTGVTTDVERRIHEHNHTTKAAKYTRIRRPVTLLYQQSYENRQQACQREWQIKQLSRGEKLALIQSGDAACQADQA
ncbi:GIY-YIG nuclease family protein [Salinibius halmophilus]|uniref:GIY-YIG nuclease family protein n=1 Tax=Salinibius halmophilus TaxID=1853216 RepID=UPI000E6733BF|nr:GIY-YIG nuclease family protein [Salinibius halmophilus]